jgi:tetratricopeptide (TPR) repeat protein
MLNASWFVPACGTVAKEVVRKHFEIPACNACLIAEESPGLRAAGFVDMKNCVFAEEHDVLDKVSYLFAHQDELRSVIEAGSHLVHSYHTIRHRDQIRQWFDLYKGLNGNKQIVQPDPFGPLRLIEGSARSEASHLVCNGAHLRLLREGDNKLWAGHYEQAEKLYLRCIHYIPWMPEPHLRLALCYLYKGDAKAALSWISKPIQLTLAEYKATDADPVEWAYFVVSLLCLGRLADAVRFSNQFLWLRHPELDRVRWVTSLLYRGGSPMLFLRNNDKQDRVSVHQLPIRNLREWMSQLCVMLTACGQSQLANAVATTPSHEVSSLPAQREVAMHNQPAPEREGDGRTIPPERAPSARGGKDAARMFKKQLLHSAVRQKMKRAARLILHRLETRYGYFLPYHLSKARNDEFFEAIHRLAREEDINSVLVIGGAESHGSVEALLAGTHENTNDPPVLCMTISERWFSRFSMGSPRKHISKLYRVAAPRPRAFCDELRTTIQTIKRENELSAFDVVLIIGSQLPARAPGTLVDELCNARFVLLEDINHGYIYSIYEELLNKPEYVLVERNAELRGGYAIFTKEGSAGLHSRHTTLSFHQ